MRLTQIPEIAIQRLKRFNVNLEIRHMADQVSQDSNPDPGKEPVVVFNASTRLVGMSLNAAYALLTSWALRLRGTPVVQFTCWAGMSHCVLGTSRQEVTKSPPCQACITQSKWLYTGAQVSPFTYSPDQALQNALENLRLQQLQEFEYQPGESFRNLVSPPLSFATLPLGKLVLPSVRWVLRRHTLQDDEPTCFLLRQYILSAYRVAQEFSALLDKLNPMAVVLFNGQFFPEATARWICQQRNIRSLTHEVGLQPYSAFFTTGEATAYPLDIPEDFELTDEQNIRLDAYLDQRFLGKFSMAGVHFWYEMKGLDASLLARIEGFKQVVPVFTNVIFDTSQPHSNVLFPDMFAWLDLILEVASVHPETLFIIRAHPDEDRPGKESDESVQQWAELRQLSQIPNVLLVSANQMISSYELIQRAKFVMIYNSTIGLEASIMGALVLCAGRSRFTQIPTVIFPTTLQEYRLQLEELIDAETISVPPHFQSNARRFLYYQLYRSSLPFNEFLQEDGIWPGFVRLKQFDLDRLTPQASPTIKTILAGILDNGDFLLDSDV